MLCELGMKSSDDRNQPDPGPETGAVALTLPGLPPLPIVLERRVVKPSGYHLIVRIHLPARPDKGATGSSLSPLCDSRS